MTESDQTASGQAERTETEGKASQGAETQGNILLSPWQLNNGQRLANRVVLAPMTRARAGISRIPNALMAEYYAQRASAGLLISEGVAISEQALGWNQSPGIYTDAMQAAWQPIVSGVQARGAVFYLQLWHCGRASHSSFRDDRSLAVAPSAIPLQGDGIHTPTGKHPYEVPRMLELEEIPRVVEDYRRATERARQAGFDGVEIHAANGYLVDEFLQSRTNQRTDRYGGSLANRFRFLQEIVESLTAMWPGHVAVRLSPNGVFNDMGSPDFREMFLFVAERLAQYPLAYLHVCDGLAFGFHQLGEPLTLPDFRAVYPGTLMGNCGYDQESANRALASGVADLIAFGRPFLSNPDLVERFAHGWPLAAPADPSVWYSHDASGFTDFPRYGEQ